MHSGALPLDGESTAVTSEGDAVSAISGLETIFGAGFDATERGFNGGSLFAPVVQFTVVPEPSVGLLIAVIFLIWLQSYANEQFA